VVASELGLAAKQLADGRVLASDLRAEGDPERDAPLWRAKRARRLPPPAATPRAAELRRAREQQLRQTPDHNPLLGELPGAEGVWLAAGFSGHGFMLAPADSRRLAAAIAGEPPDPLLESFRPGRFDAAAPVAEAQII
jgi:sarcosine oxidase subunit beta